MAKQSQIDKAIQKLQDEIDVRQSAIDILRAVKNVAPKAKLKRVRVKVDDEKSA